MTRTLYLHCGPPKTGTSAIQAYLRDNRRHPDLLYPQTGQWGDGAHHHLPFALKGMTSRGPVQVQPLDQLSADLTAEIAAAPDRDVLISSEGLTPKDTFPIFQTVFSDLIAQFDRVKTLVVLRHTLERASSAYNQNIKDPSVAESRLPDEYLAKASRGFALMPFVRKWRDAVPDVIFLNYHPAQGLLRRFMAALDREFDETYRRRKRNLSFGGPAILTLFLADRLGATPEQRAGIFEAMRTDDTLSLHQGSSLLFSGQAMQACLDSIGPDLEAVKRTLGLDLTGLYPALPHSYSMTADEAEALRRRLDPLQPDAAQRAEMDALLGRFQGAGGL